MNSASSNADSAEALGSKGEPIGIDTAPADDVIDHETLHGQRDQLLNNLRLTGAIINNILACYNPDPIKVRVLDTDLVDLDGVAHQDRALKNRSKVHRSTQRLVFPIHQSNAAHWILCVADLTLSRAILFDPSRDEPCKQKYAESVLLAVRTFAPQVAWVLGSMETSLRQSNGVDCGLYVCVVAIYWMHGKEFPGSLDCSLWRKHFAILFGSEGEPYAGVSKAKSIQHLMKLGYEGWIDALNHSVDSQQQMQDAHCFTETSLRAIQTLAAKKAQFTEDIDWLKQSEKRRSYLITSESYRDDRSEAQRMIRLIGTLATMTPYLEKSLQRVQYTTRYIRIDEESRALVRLIENGIGEGHGAAARFYRHRSVTVQHSRPGHMKESQVL